MARKKILWLCSWYPSKVDPFNGDFIQRHAQAAALFNDIHVIHAIHSDYSLFDSITEELKQSPGLTEQIIYIPRKKSWWSILKGHLSWHRRQQAAIHNYIRSERPSIVHVNVPWRAGMYALMIKARQGLDYVVTEHWGIYNDVEVLNYSGRKSTFKRFTIKIFKEAKKFISVSRYLGEGVNKLVVKKDFEIVPNVVNTQLFFYKERPAAPFRFVHVSNMVPLKNAEGILEAFKLFLQEGNQGELIMVGDKDPTIREYAKKIGLGSDAVHFRGEIPYAEVAKEMQQANAFILFSNIENSPCVIGEALCCGLPVIATRVGGVPELLDETNSILVEAGDTQTLATAMARIQKKPLAYDTKKIAENAQGKFSYKVIGKKLDDIYSEAIAGA